MLSLSKDVDSYITSSITAIQDLKCDQFIEFLTKAAHLCLECERSGNKIMLAGNGGSAADAQHIAGEFVSRFAFDRPALNAVSLATDTSVITAIANDYGYEQVFSRQVEGIGRPGDVLIAYSTSGKSRNIVNALSTAGSMGIGTILLTGRQWGEACEVASLIYRVNSDSTPIIQQVHGVIGHILCLDVEKSYFGS